MPQQLSCFLASLIPAVASECRRWTMSEQYGFPPPPIPNSGYFSTRRRVTEQPPSITTAVGRVQSTQSLTPRSGTSSFSIPFPFSPHVTSPPQQGSLHPALPVPSTMSSQAYNPRQWSQRGHGSGSQMFFSRNTQPNTWEVTGMEGGCAFSLRQHRALTRASEWEPERIQRVMPKSQKLTTW